MPPDTVPITAVEARDSGGRRWPPPPSATAEVLVPPGQLHQRRSAVQRSTSSSVRSSTLISRLLAPCTRRHQLVELQVDRVRVLVLRPLDEEHHQEGDDGGAGVDDELPAESDNEEGDRHRPDISTPTAMAKGLEPPAQSGTRARRRHFRNTSAIRALLRFPCQCSFGEFGACFVARPHPLPHALGSPIGGPRIVTPWERQPSSTALATARGPGIAPPSPTPLAPERRERRRDARGGPPRWSGTSVAVGFR